MTTTCPTPATSADTLRKPRYYVNASDQSYTIRVEMPGVSKDAVSIDYDKGVLTIQGQRKHVAPEGWKPLHRELNDLGYVLRLKLNGLVDEDKLGAQLTDGVLNVTLPIREAAKPRRIAVN